MNKAKQLFTIGYEGSVIDDFVAVLSSKGIEVLCDVRDVTSSRKKGFSKNPLAEALATAGIRYLHFKALGDPKEGRLAARAGDFALFRKIYGDHLRTAEARAALDELDRLASISKACLMCFERDPRTCHRNIVAQRLFAKSELQVIHLGVPPGFVLKDRSWKTQQKEVELQ